MSNSVSKHSSAQCARYRSGKGNVAGRQSGVAAVELAIILTILVSMLALPFFFARVFLHYSVMQKAAQNAAIYFATIPAVEMNDPIWSDSAQEIAEEIAEETVAELNPGGRNKVKLVILCDGSVCGISRPTSISVDVRTRIVDDIFAPFTYLYRGGSGIELNAKVTVPYLGD